MQLGLAAELGKPVVVHAREADDDVAAMLAAARVAVVLHSFSSGPNVFEAGVAIGAYFLFSRMITFKNWTITHRPTPRPPGPPLGGTDAPYPAPGPPPGPRNEAP